MRNVDRVFRVAISLAACGAASAEALPPGTRFQCFDKATRKTEISQQQFATCNGVQTRITPGGASTTITENVEPAAPTTRPLMSRDDRMAATLLAQFPNEATQRRARDRATAPILDTIARIERERRGRFSEVLSMPHGMACEEQARAPSQGADS